MCDSHSHLIPIPISKPKSYSHSNGISMGIPISMHTCRVHTRARISNKTVFGLSLLYPANTRILQQKCTTICHFQTKKLHNFLGLGSSPDPTPFSTPYENEATLMSTSYSSRNPGRIIQWIRQNDWRDVVRPLRCNAFAIARFLLKFVTLIDAVWCCITLYRQLMFAHCTSGCADNTELIHRQFSSMWSAV